MTNGLGKDTQNAVLKAVAELVNKLDDAKTSGVAEDHTKALQSMQLCLQGIKVKLNVVQSEQKAFHENRKDRSENCDKIHTDFEQRLRKVPAPAQCREAKEIFGALQTQVGEVSEKRVEKIEIEIGKVTPFMYKAVGAAIGLSIIITPLIGGVVTYIAKKIGGG